MIIALNEMQNESSITHRKHLSAGLTVQWVRSSAQDSPDQTWDVVCYSDESRWVIDNESAEELTLLGCVSDGLNTCEILESGNGAIIALYAGGIQSFSDREAWVESLPDSDKSEAEAMIKRVIPWPLS